MTGKLRDTVVYYDHIAWYYINTQWHNSFFDAIMPFFRNPWFWAPLYLFLLLFLPGRFGKKGALWCAAFLLCFAIGDQVSAHLIKPHIHRLRPCNNPYLASIIHIIVPCGGGYSFPSSHATNHFAMGIFSALTLGRYARWVWPAAIFWAALIAYSQVYVGVHFPFDVTCGASLGSIIGVLVGKLFNRFVGLENPVIVTAS